jgi:hypothetical protein
MERSPEAARIGRAIAKFMREQDISRPELAERIGRLTGERPGPMTVSRRVKGEIHLATIKRVAEYAPNKELTEVAEALVMDEDGTVDREAAEKLARKLANAALRPDKHEKATTEAASEAA